MAMRNPQLLLPTAQAAPTDTHHLRKPSSQSDQIALTPTLGDSPSGHRQWLCCCPTYGTLPPDLALCSGHQGCWPNKDNSHTRSQACWHPHLAPAPKPFQFSEDLGRGPGSLSGSEQQAGLARGNHGKQKSRSLKQPFKCLVQLGRWPYARVGARVCKCTHK